MARIVVVEDDADLRDSVCRYLTLIGLDACGAASGQELFALQVDWTSAVVVLDVNLPDCDGFTVARRLRSLCPTVGIIMLTARNQVDDRVTGLTSGADSYLVKPVQLRELLAVIESLSRRLNISDAAVPVTPLPAASLPAFAAVAPPVPSPVRSSFKPSPATLAGNPWVFEVSSWSLFTPQGAQVSLTNAEFRVLRVLVADAGHSVSRDQISEALGKAPGEQEDRSIDAILTRLRRKVREETGLPLPVKAARTVGYVFVAPVTVQE